MDTPEEATPEDEQGRDFARRLFASLTPTEGDTE